MDDDADPPIIGQSFSVETAMETLDHGEMLALSELFADWSANEPGLDTARRRRFAAYAREYRALAEHLGRDWRASCPEDPPDLIVFIARQARRAYGL